MSKKTPELLSFIGELNSKGLKSKQIAEQVKEQLGIEISDRSVRLWLKQEIDTELTQVRKLKDEIEYTNPFEFEGDDIVFYYKDETGTKKISIPIDEVRMIWEDYSKHGTNLTGQQIIVKYELNPKVWQLIKSRLQLYKDSDLIPDFLLDKIEKEQGTKKVEEIIEEVSHKAVFNKYNNILVGKYNRQKESEYKKAITQLYDTENFLEMLKGFIDNYEPRDIKFDSVEQIDNDNLYVAISDIHMGKEGTQDILKRISNILEDIKSRPETNVTMFCLGDIVENLVIGGMHKNQEALMDGPFSFDLILETAKVFENMLIEIRKSGKNVKFIGQTGNHDRISEKDSMDYTGGLVIYEMIKRGLQTTDIQVNYLRDVWDSYISDDLHFILQHGHLGGTKKKMKDILWEFGDNSKHNIILQGHIHHGAMEDGSANATRITIPSLAGEGNYDKSLGLSSYPGYITIKTTRDGLPNIQFIRLR